MRPGASWSPEWPFWSGPGTTSGRALPSRHYILGCLGLSVPHLVFPGSLVPLLRPSLVLRGEGRCFFDIEAPRSGL